MLLELNDAETTLNTLHKDPYCLMVETYASTFDPGSPFVLNELVLRNVEAVASKETTVENALQAMRGAIESLTELTVTTGKEVKTSIEEALVEKSEEAYNNLAKAAREAELPTPFNGANEAERFFEEGQVNADAITTAFTYNDKALTAKRGLWGKKKPRFPAGVILDFLFTKNAKTSLRIKDFGPKTRGTICECARWLMGEVWPYKCEKDIMIKVSRHFHYTDKTVVRRSVRRVSKRKHFDD